MQPSAQPMSPVFDENIKKEIQKALADKILQALENKQMDLLQMKDASGYILDNMTNIKSYIDSVTFLEGLKNTWPVFADIYTIYKNKLGQDREKVVIDKLTSYINNSN